MKSRIIQDQIEPRAMEHSLDGGDERYAAVRQYSLAQILAVWAAAAVPMGVLAWIVAPWLKDQLGGDEPLMQALLICLTAGLIWQFLLVAILIRRELGGLEWSRVRNALWLRAPRDPKTGRMGGRVWLWVLPFVVLFALSYPSRRFQSAWMGIVVHSVQTVVVLGVVMALVLG